MTVFPRTGSQPAPMQPPATVTADGKGPDLDWHF